MGTRSMIGMVEADGSVSAIYCHWDGYLSHNGKILDEHYDSDIKVAELIALGNLSSLGVNLEPENTKPLVGGEAAERYESIAEYRKGLGDNSDEFRYLWDGAAWFYISEKQDVWDDVREGLKDIPRAKVA